MRVLLLLLVVGCGGGHHLGDGGVLDDGSGGSGGTGATGGAGGSGGVGGSGGSGGTAGSGGSGGADAGCPPASNLMNCYPTCTSAATCSSATSGAFTASHYSCDGVCRYNGCNTDDECQASYQQTGKTYRCVLLACTSIRFCQQACTSAADCASETTSGGAFGADNYACDGGLCKYLGCRSDAECQTSLSASGHSYVCRSSYCQEACSAPADCALSTGGAYGADRYACDQGVCRWLGCNSDASCQQTFMSPNFACR